MVHLTGLLFRIKPDQLGKNLGRKFIDRLRIYVRSGAGGTGIPKLGGIGGDGGSIKIKACNNITLRDVYSQNLRKRYFAENGEKSKKIKLFGANGKDVLITVPCGVTAVTDQGENLGEVNNEDEIVTLVKGGQGASPLNDYKPEEGKAISINLDLKLIADVGLIGFPNAGKSTLMSLVSRAQPKIANYPFTTINPQLGIIEFEDQRKLSIADLPGIIEGAHENRGMGHKFLKHASRTKVNLFLVDINGFQLNPKFKMRSAFETAVFLNKELELYDSSLIEKPSILVLNKMDTEDAGPRFDEFMRLYENYEKSLESIEKNWWPNNRIQFRNIFPISAKTNQNVDNLCIEIRELIDELDDAKRDDKRRNHENSRDDDEPGFVPV